MHNKIVSGIVFGILLANQEKVSHSPEHLIQDLSSIVRDHYSHVIEIFVYLVNQCYEQLKEVTLRQILWLSEILITKNVPGVKHVFLYLLRQIRPNVLDSKSVSLEICS